MIVLDENEKIYLIKRRHPIALRMELFPEIFIFLIIAILTIFLLVSPSPSWPNWLIKFVPTLSQFKIRYLLLFFFSLLLLFFWQIIFLVITYYYLDCWIVTNQRTIHTELKGLFSQVFSSVPHDKIQDITIDVQGILPTFFHFGNLQIQTAGEFRKFIFYQIPEPEKTKEVIFDARREFLQQMKKDGMS
ncbi:hypothetical protein AMJ49_01270 [Parcubacteria bacterium DG_74_2]|nr:MAG: hypothetical protein AMJ49_01270 [Parcubacteria bacterium DG_74_2]